MGQASQQQQQSDNSMAPIWIIILLFLVGWIIWYTGHAYIVAFVFKLKMTEAELVNLVVGHMDKVMAYMRETNPATVTFNQLSEVSEYIGDYLRYPIIIILSLLSIILYYSNVTLKFRRTYNMDSFKRSEIENWPQIRPVAQIDLIDTDLHTGPWAMALNPVEFCKKNDLLRKDTLRAGQKSSIRDTGPGITIKRSESKRLFTMQLGEYWEGPQHLPIYVKALLACFAAKLNRDRDSCYKLLDQINLSTSSGKLNFSGVDELLYKHVNKENVQKIMSQHAYTLTVMASILEAARNDGVLCTADFLWLRPVDRTLWYMLNTIGRQTPFVEVAGPFAHWRVEKELQHRVMVPMIDEAVKALDVAVKEVKLKREEVMALDD